MRNPVFEQLGVSLLLGLLVGLQRERSQSPIAGIRTFALIAVLGTVCAWLGNQYGVWIVAAGLVGVAALFVIGYSGRLEGAQKDPGLTTEVAGLLMYCIGVYVVVGPLPAAVVLGGVLAVLLHFKQPLHGLVARIGDADLKAIMQFVLITLVILPVLPNARFGPFQVLNPFKLWLMVVLIVGIGLVGYLVHKGIGERTGALLGGLLGGLISSTATTVSFARRVRGTATGAEVAALVIVLASTTVFIRVLVEIAAVAPRQFGALSGPVGAMLAACGLIALWSYWQSRQQQASLGETGNPAELKSALLFAGIYAVVLVTIAFARQHLGNQALYAVAIVSGLTDMDAITLSTAQLVETGSLPTTTGWRLILTASLSNLVFKAGIVAVVGNASLLRLVCLRFGLALLAGLVILVGWPQ